MSEKINKLDVLKMSMQEAYHTFINLIGEEDKELYVRVRYGSKERLQFDIYEWINGNMIVKKKKGIAVIRWNGKRVITIISEIQTEIESRERIMKNAIMKHIETETIVEERENKRRGI